MIKTFECIYGYNYTYIGIASVEDGRTVELRYYTVNPDFTITEIKTYCIEMRKLERKCRTWCAKMGFILYTY